MSAVQGTAVQTVLFPQLAIETKTERIRRQAREAREASFSAWFRSRAREFGGINDRNRAQITAESVEYGRRAAEAVYRRNGYTPCNNAPACQNLVSPGYNLCPSCAW